MNPIKQLNQMISQSSSIVFFGGAGVSTESQLKDFRGSDGLYQMKSSYPVEYLLSLDTFLEKPELFFQFYLEQMNFLDAVPNVTHRFLKELEDQGKLSWIVTQNIDGLHQKVGCRNVLELHGTIYENYCTRCHKFYEARDVFLMKGIPRCSCGGIIKPNVVLYGESLNETVIKQAIEAISHADLLIVAGTSLMVEPARSFIRFFQGKYLVIINQTKTFYEDQAQLVIHDRLGNVFSKLKCHE